MTRTTAIVVYVVLSNNISGMSVDDCPATRAASHRAVRSYNCGGAWSDNPGCLIVEYQYSIPD